MSSAARLCASHEVGGPFTLGRQMLRLVGSEPGWHTNAREQLLHAFVEPSAGTDVASAPLPLSLRVDPRFRTRYFGDEHYRFLAHALVGVLERRSGSILPTIVVCHAERADATDREVLRLVERRASVVRTGGGEHERAGEYPDAALRAMRTTPHLPAAALRSWHDGRAAELGATAHLPEHHHALVHHLLHGTTPDAAIPHLGALLLGAARLGFYEAALRAGRVLFEDRPWPADFDDDFAWQLTTYCIALAASGKRSEALALRRTAVGRWPDPELHASAHYTAAMLHARHGRHDEHDLDEASRLLDLAIAAAERIEDAKRRAHRRAFLDNAVALVEMRRGDAHRALAMIDTGLTTLDREFDAAETSQHRVVSRANRATVLMHSGEVERALADLDYVVSADPYTPEYRVERAIAAHAAGRRSDALADLTFAIENCVVGPEAYHDRAILRLDDGDHGGAVEDLRAAFELDPADLDILATLCESLLATDQLDEAATRLAGWDQADERKDVLEARLAAARNDHALAVLTLTHAIERNRESPLLYAERSTMLHQLDRADEALADLDLALDLGGPPEVIEANRIAVLAGCGRVAEAREAAARLRECGELTDDVDDHLRRVLSSTPEPLGGGT